MTHTLRFSMCEALSISLLPQRAPVLRTAKDLNRLPSRHSARNTSGAPEIVTDQSSLIGYEHMHLTLVLAPSNLPNGSYVVRLYGSTIVPVSKKKPSCALTTMVFTATSMCSVRRAEGWMRRISCAARLVFLELGEHEDGAHAVPARWAAGGGLSEMGRITSGDGVKLLS